MTRPMHTLALVCAAAWTFLAVTIVMVLTDAGQVDYADGPVEGTAGYLVLGIIVPIALHLAAGARKSINATERNRP